MSDDLPHVPKTPRRTSAAENKPAAEAEVKTPRKTRAKAPAPSLLPDAGATSPRAGKKSATVLEQGIATLKALADETGLSEVINELRSPADPAEPAAPLSGSAASAPAASTSAAAPVRTRATPRRVTPVVGGTTAEAGALLTPGAIPGNTPDRTTEVIPGSGPDDLDTWSELDAGVLQALAHGRLNDPFAVLGPHHHAALADGTAGLSGAVTVRTYVPGALGVELLVEGQPARVLSSHALDGLFTGNVDLPGTLPLARRYRLRTRWPGPDHTEVAQESADPYAFGLLLGDLDLHLIAEGRHRELGRCLGAQAMQVDGIEGVRFAVWAPNAMRVSVVGDFNGWDGRRHVMRLRHRAGVWELFIPQNLGAQPGQRYKYEIVDQHGTVLPHKADPVALQTEAPPATASVIAEPREFEWHDAEWLQQRAAKNQSPGAVAAPMMIYEVHVGSWMREVNDPQRGWTFLAEQLIPYARGMGFTHIELLPVMEYPFGGSWGYQPLSQFAPTARYGSPRDFAAFVDRCHSAGLGVILDWVPAHFPTDTHGLAQFDGTALYEYADPREGFHRDWDTLIYNLGRHEVRGFMIASALEWLERFHVDALRVDAVASMLYRDYSRKAGEWLPNQYGGRENLESVAFLRELNQIIAQRVPGALTIAEESTAWPGVSASVEDGGLGFSFKWNMGWMHDTLHYIEHEPVYRAWHHSEMTFGLVYAWSEQFVLPLSHDEVVHGKGSLLGKMPGDRWQQFANLRAYFGFMWAHPGKKLLFMGGELAQPHEWNHDGEIDWSLLASAEHGGVQRLVTDLNHLLAQSPALYRQDASPAGFEWVIGDDQANSVYAFIRHAGPDAGNEMILAVSNLTPVPRTGYRIGVPVAGYWQECLNTDAAIYGGSNLGNGGGAQTETIPAHGKPVSLLLTLPPLATVFLRLRPE